MHGFGLGIFVFVVVLILDRLLFSFFFLPSPRSQKKKKKKRHACHLMLRSAREIGVPHGDMFDVPALYENKDLGAVVQCLHSLGRAAQSAPGFAGPHLGAKLATENKRNFSEEQMRAGATTATFISQGSSTAAAAGTAFSEDTSRNIVRGGGGPTSSEATKIMQGSHGGATQAGMTDNSRNIVRPTGEKK
jgi:hypothetical protein